MWVKEGTEGIWLEGEDYGLERKWVLREKGCGRGDFWKVSVRPLADKS